MSAQILDGRATAKAITEELQAEVADLTAKVGRAPVLATVLIGDDPASHTYVKMKINRCRQVGIEPRKIELDHSTTTEEAVAAVRRLSEDAEVDGILVQHPAPPQVDEAAVFEAIDPAKDVDGVTSGSLASMAFNEGGFRSATPGGIMRLFERYGIELEGKHAVVVGRSRILGIPMGLLLLGQNATVTYCHSRTTDLADHVGRADIVVAAAGRPELIKGEWLKAGAVVADAGYADNTGDVEFGSAADRARWITPVPGGVGPMTIACLLEQTVQSFKQRTRLA
ncbi:bifunctional 5,10-methylenetetrahydrofolate dehydrogenase/5,10-methenyltetrahydrofolate cyclohydrolase [Nesterenkonia flava]|uniref:Bifunctional protein FolD n=1 Tax=Nesterenkonia flava TaxID=469799 RepID=A0ABU1FPL9_9MICC|nr:tetrahydrofolate dehydrogenase/cyclohydrolase catalytic domain-containing protein [Nesterenkonia flava]MDR5710586.1 tetrahydrofolate dehydrogenase/cyclohydrolase catalytic domain-containing protein [Nesterenkonia flava]